MALVGVGFCFQGCGVLFDYAETAFNRVVGRSFGGRVLIGVRKGMGIVRGKGKRGIPRPYMEAIFL